MLSNNKTAFLRTLNIDKGIVMSLDFLKNRSLYFHVSQIKLAELIALSGLVEDQVPDPHLVPQTFPRLQPCLGLRHQLTQQQWQ